jgi:hypothetical protein
MPETLACIVGLKIIERTRKEYGRKQSKHGIVSGVYEQTVREGRLVVVRYPHHRHLWQTFEFSEFQRAPGAPIRQFK